MYARSISRRTRKKKTAVTQVEIHSDRGALEVPGWVVDHDSYRRWARSDEFPEEGRICFLNGEVWVDMSRQQVFSHVRVKSVLAAVVEGLVQQAGTGIFLGDGLRVFNTAADLSAVPDGTYMSYDSLRKGRVRLVEGRKGGYTGVEGSPDLAHLIQRPPCTGTIRQEHEVPIPGRIDPQRRPRKAHMTESGWRHPGSARRGRRWWRGIGD